MLPGIEQIIAPRKRVAQSLLPCRDILCPHRQDLQAVFQAGQEPLWRKQFDAGCCQFDGERQAVQAHTDLGNGTGVSAGQLEVGFGSLRRLQEEGYCRILCKGFALWKMSEVGQRQGWDGKLVFTTDV